MADPRSHHLLELLIKPRISIALDNLFSGAVIPADKIAELPDIKTTLGMRVISALRLFTDCDIGRHLGSLNTFSDNVSDIEFNLAPSQAAGLSAIPPQSLKTESLRLIYTLCDNQVTHLSHHEIPQAAEAASKLSTLREFAYSYAAAELGSVFKALEDIGIELNKAIKENLDFACHTSKTRGDNSVNADTAKHSAKAVMDVFQGHNKSRDQSAPATAESLLTKLFTCFNSASEKVTKLAK